MVDSDGESELTSPDSDSSDPMPQPRSRGTKRTVQKQSSDAESTLRAPSFKLPRELDQDPSSVEPSSAKPLFRVPISERSFATRGDKPSRSSPERDDSQLMATFGGVDDDEPEAGKPVEQAMCPFCDEPVDAGFLKEHTKSRMTMAMATRFCREHKKQSARETWKSRNYPTIDWDSLSARVARHDDLVSRLLEQGSRSFYRDLLAENVKAGRNRTLLKTAVSESIIPGYFGPRGLRVMSESITSRFSSALRDSAIRDRLISARGHGVFVGQVLVPEVAVRLIMEDMGVSEEMARDVLQESSEIGELLNEDLGDHIADDHHRGDDVEEGY